MRVSLPVDPYYKVMSEVATVRWIRHFISILVPDIVAFDLSTDNEIGFEWILISLMSGVPLYSLWRKCP